MKKTSVILSAALSVSVLAACGEVNENLEEEMENEEAGENINNETNDDDSNENNMVAENEDAVEVEFWHGMGGGLGDTLEELVADYNDSQNDYVVQPEYQGSYEELLTQFRNVGGTDTSPAMVQMFEVGTKYMIDSGYINPIQEWIDRDDYDIDQLEENILSYYSVDDQLYSMPFNSSTPALFYNKDKFEEAGLDPDNPPRTFDEIEEAADALTDDDTYGFSMLGHGWFFEQLIATQGQDYVDNENGRAGEASEVTFDGEEGLKAYEWLESMNENGSFEYYGRDWDDLRAAFQTENVAMYMDSSAGTKDAIDDADFDVGVAYVPHPDDTDPNGIVIGGASAWMADGIPEEEQEGVWDFMQYFNTPEVQAEWHVNTGYFSTHPDAYDEEVVETEHDEYPELTVPIDQLQDTVPSSATQGALITVFPESREEVVSSLEELYQGMSPEEALEQAAEGSNRAIEVSDRASD